MTSVWGALSAGLRSVYAVTTMPGIFIAALIVTGEWALIHVRRLLTDEPKVSAKLLALAMALTLPMCAIALFAVRIPFDAWLRGWLGAHPAYPWPRCCH